MKSRTALFKNLSAGVAESYTDRSWPSAKRWIARIGLPRLCAEEAAGEAAGLLNSISLSIHRNEPELYAMLEAARKAVSDYQLALMRDDWRRFEGRPKE